MVSILICTIDAGIEKVPRVLMPPMGDVSYVVSMQYTDDRFLQLIPRVLEEREDVTVTTLEGRGLSRNRNNAIAHATGDVCVIADDDNRYERRHIDAIVEAYEKMPDADIIIFQAETLEGKPLHPYPADYVCSVEMTFRRGIGIRFDERFGLGSEHLCSGEEEVFLKDARDKGLSIRHVPKVIVATEGVTTGDTLVGNRKLQLSKGATFRHMFGMGNALWRSAKEAGWHMVHGGANPFPIFMNMCRGVFLYR